MAPRHQLDGVENECESWPCSKAWIMLCKMLMESSSEASRKDRFKGMGLGTEDLATEQLALPIAEI